MILLLSSALLAAVQAPPTSLERFVDVARTQDMVQRCARLDSRPATKARVARARTAATALAARARASGHAAYAARGARDWTAMRDGVDTSCIVGPGETDRSAYAALVTDYETAIRAAGAALPPPRKGR